MPGDHRWLRRGDGAVGQQLRVGANDLQGALAPTTLPITQHVIYNYISFILFYMIMVLDVYTLYSTSELF